MYVHMLINKWEADIYRSFVNLNDVSLNLNELGNEVRIPANQISEYMDSASMFASYNFTCRFLVSKITILIFSHEDRKIAKHNFQILHSV